MELLNSLSDEDFKCKNLWIKTGGIYTKEGYYVPICIDVIENTKINIELYAKRMNSFHNKIFLHKWCLK